MRASCPASTTPVTSLLRSAALPISTIRGRLTSASSVGCRMHKGFLKRRPRGDRSFGQALRNALALLWLGHRRVGGQGPAVANAPLGVRGSAGPPRVNSFLLVQRRLLTLTDQNGQDGQPAAVARPPPNPGPLPPAAKAQTLAQSQASPPAARNRCVLRPRTAGPRRLTERRGRLPNDSIASRRRTTMSCHVM